MLEAALILPLFLFILLFLILMVRLSLIQMALHDAAGQTVRQTAAHVYPAWLAAAGAAQQQPAGAAGAAGAAEAAEAAEAAGAAEAAEAAGVAGPAGATGIVDVKEVAASLAELLPDPAGPVLSALVRGDWKPAVDMAASEFGGVVVLPLVRELAGTTILEPERIELAGLQLPDLQGSGDSMLLMKLSYDVPLGLPFTKDVLTLHAAAAERVWIPDETPASGAGKDGAEDGRQLLRIVGLQPVPVRPGRKARLVVQTDPGASVSLSVLYKSGRSKARHLGEAQANEDGIVVWEWLVSGNTTPGTWQLSVTAADGGETGTYFDVVRKKE